MEQVRILVVEDEIVVAMSLVEMLEDLGYDVCESAIGYSEALEILEQEQPDLALLDITLGGAKSGIDLATVIRQRYEMPIIFLTSHHDKETVHRAMAVKPNGYLVKPFKEEDLYTSIEAALVNYSSKAPTPELNTPAPALTETAPVLVKDSIFVRTGNLYVKVRVDEILWVESDKNYVVIVVPGHRYSVRSSFKAMLAELPPNQFVQCHKSYAINIQRLEALNHSVVVMEGKAEVPLSRNHRDNVYACLKRMT